MLVSILQVEETTCMEMFAHKFEMLSVKLVECCSREDREQTQQLLELQLTNSATTTTVVDLAADGGNKHFVAHNAPQKVRS